MKLPRPVSDAIRVWMGHYSNMGADYSVTDLINTPRIVQLRKRYVDVLPPEEPEDLVKPFLGTAIHNLFEKTLRQYEQRHPGSYLVEYRCWDRILNRKISGQFDLYDLRSNTLYDFKTTSVWKLIFGSTKEWEQQLNLYGWFLRQMGLDVRRVRVISILLDWDRQRMFREKDYPRDQIRFVNIPLWSLDKQEKFLLERITLMKTCEELDDDHLPECTDEEMWASPTTWAVEPDGGGRAKRVLNTYEEAKEWLTKKKFKNHSVVKRPGTRTRCEKYCPVQSVCSQYITYQAKLSEESAC